MSCIVYGEPVGRWWAETTGTTYHSGMQAIGLSKDGYVTAACVFENFNGASVVAHLAVKGRMTRQFLHELADYAFNRCKVKKLIAPVENTNDKMWRLAMKMGFYPEALIKDAQPHGDLMIFTMTSKQCRFLEERYKNGKTLSASVA